MDRIHWSKIWELMEMYDENGKPVPFSISFVKRKTGEWRDVPSCTLSSIHSKGSTLNILLPGEIRPKSIRKCLVMKFNGMSVYQ